MEKLPPHGRVDCSRCFGTCGRVDFDETRRTEQGWRITANPLAWGSEEPEIIVLGFSKGPTQVGALGRTPHDQIAYKGGRKNIGKILRRIGLLDQKPGESLEDAVSREIADRSGRFHFGSLIRCTVEREQEGKWKGTGGGMLDRFVASPLGREVAGNCTSRFLSTLPGRTKLIVMLGLGTGLGYVRECLSLYQKARPGNWRRINEVSYTDGKVVVVHVEHFKSQGPLIPQWLGEKGHPRGRYAELAEQGVAVALSP